MADLVLLLQHTPGDYPIMPGSGRRDGVRSVVEVRLGEIPIGYESQLLSLQPRTT